MKFYRSNVNAYAAVPLAGGRGEDAALYNDNPIYYRCEVLLPVVPEGCLRQRGAGSETAGRRLAAAKRGQAEQRHVRNGSI